MNRKRILRIISAVACFAGIFFMTGYLWSDIFYPFIFNQAGDFRTDGIFKSLSPILLQLHWFLLFGWVCGVPLFVAGITGIFLTQSALPDYHGLFQQHRFGSTAIGVAFFSHILVFVFSVGFFFIPAGTPIRPMGWSVLMFYIAFWTVINIVPLSISAIIKERPRFWGVIGLILGFTPIFFSGAILDLAVAVKKLIIED